MSYGLLVPGNVVKQKVAEASNITGTIGSREDSKGKKSGKCTFSISPMPRPKCVRSWGVGGTSQNLFSAFVKTNGGLSNTCSVNCCVCMQNLGSMI